VKYAQQGFSKCGTNGAACGGCTIGKSCMAGVCTTPSCDACLDTAGNCRTDRNTLTDNGYCGRDGGFCAVCDSLSTCTAGRCIGMGGSCNVGNCDGCCSGDTCIGLSDGGVGDAQCGVGAAACQTCTNGTCNTTTGQCDMQMGTGGGIAFPFPDGGFTTCDSSNCPTGCCDFTFGCMMDGQDPTGSGLIQDCVAPDAGGGDACLTCALTCALGMALNACF
jgi:hypothetical protein